MNGYQGIRFKYADIKRDLESMKSLAASFLDEQHDGVLSQCETDLENIRNATTRRVQTWTIPQERPLRTCSTSRYRDTETGGGFEVYGELSFIWQIRNPDIGRRRQHYFHLVECASTSLRIKIATTDEMVGQWQFEAGDSNSPGCHFHSSVNQYQDDGLFPEWLKVPRFLGYLVSPLDGLEFILGELFQSAWHQAVSRPSHHRNAWAGSQKQRLQRLMEWQLRQINEADTTPWMSLKKAKPELDLLTS